MTRNEFKNILENEVGRDEAVWELIDFCNDNGLEEYVDDIVDNDMLDQMVESKVSDGWISVACFLSGIEYINDDYYIIDGYGNARNITNGDIECIISDVLRDANDDIFDPEDLELDIKVGEKAKVIYDYVFDIGTIVTVTDIDTKDHELPYKAKTEDGKEEWTTLESLQKIK